MTGQPTSDSYEVSVVMPCLNEAETLAVCIQKASVCLADNGVSYEIIIADNGSSDGSQSIAEAEAACKATLLVAFTTAGVSSWNS